MALIDRPERARQLARAIASDLSLYHEKKLIEGIEKDSLFDVMRDEIDEGRALYKSRVTPEIFNMGIYDRALVDMLIKSRAHIRSSFQSNNRRTRGISKTGSPALLSSSP